MTVGDGASRRRTIGDAYSGRSSGLNLVRLLLALTAVLSHSIAIGGYGLEARFHWSTLGTLAVYGFFAISGYLIAASADSHSVGRFVWHRFLRIFPAFWCV
jgi:peptidoglycan/LPS O-acetylase OafA/YrhL